MQGSGEAVCRVASPTPACDSNKRFPGVGRVHIDVKGLYSPRARDACRSEQPLIPDTG